MITRRRGTRLLAVPLASNFYILHIYYIYYMFVMAHVMSSAQIERDFSTASLMLPSNRGSMDARYFQAQLCALVNFLHLVYPEDMSPQSKNVRQESLGVRVRL